MKLQSSQLFLLYFLTISYIPGSTATHCDSTNSDCNILSSSLCDSGTCSECAQDADCSHIHSDAICDTTSTPNMCVTPCDNKSCRYRHLSYCSLGLNQCQQCAFDSDCQHIAPYGTCYDTGSGTKICGDCTIDFNCPDNFFCINYKCSVCNPTNNEGCPAEKPRCIEKELGLNECVGCIDDSDCSNYPL